GCSRRTFAARTSPHLTTMGAFVTPKNMRKSRETRVAEAVSIHGVARSFSGQAGQVPVLRGVDLEAAPGEFVAVLGASGCGKSTLLRLVAGLDSPTAGEIKIGGRTVTDCDPRCAVVFQEPRLLPWKSVAQNVALGARGVPDAETPAVMLERVGLTGSERAWPYQLSGGMAQRVGLARAFVRKPAVLLLDEPFAALDAFTRLQMGDLLRETCRDRSRTVLLVTHDVDEALRLADRIVLLGGRPASIIAEYATAGHDASRLRAEILGRFGLKEVA
ncbi:MAG TPA: ABC transporter ATP-binding protein, partial [Thermomicrobiales bacterium]|nr:ABC transporter ATP-binding protein [Thermomicrobiales bacterium]